MTATSLPTLEAGLPRRDGGRAQAFAAARRHSALVRLLRWLLPGGAVLALLVSFAGWGLSLFALPDLQISDITLTEDGIAMDSPLLRGQDQDGRPYELRAQRAFQTVSANPVITMHELSGQIVLDDEGQSASITAPRARFDSETAIMTFPDGQVRLSLSSGGEALLGVASVDLEAGTLNSNQPVSILNDGVRLDAGGVEGFDGGARLLFTGGVRMVITPARNEEP